MKANPIDSDDQASALVGEVEVRGVDMYPLNWEDPKRVLQALKFVKATATSRRDNHEASDYLASLQNRDPGVVDSGEATVSVRLSGWDKESEYWDEELGRCEGWVSFEVTPANALALADELTRAATCAVECRPRRSPATVGAKSMRVAMWSRR